MGESRLLVVGPSWVGDMVMSQVLYRRLRARDPSCRIDVLAPAWSRPLLLAMPEVDRAIDMPLGHGELGLGRRRALGLVLREARYQQAIVLPNSFKSALAPWFAGIPRRTGWRGELRYGLLNDLRRLDEDAMPALYQRYLALGFDVGEALPQDPALPHLVADGRLQEVLASRLGLDNSPLLALCPGAGFGGAKRWPADYYGELAARFAARGWRVLLLGAGNDAAACAQAAAAGHADNLAGRTTLEESLALLARSDAVVSNDSGLLHVAAALDRPVVGIYGPTSPHFTPPLGARCRVLASALDCAPCGQRECPLGHHRCMRETGVELVEAALQEVLAA